MNEDTILPEKNEYPSIDYDRKYSELLYVRNEKRFYERMISIIRFYLDKTFPIEKIERLGNETRKRFELCQEKLSYLSKDLDYYDKFYKKSLNNLLKELGENVNQEWKDNDLMEILGYKEEDNVDDSCLRIPIPFQFAVFRLHESMRLLALTGISIVAYYWQAKTLLEPNNTDLSEQLEDVQNKLNDFLSNTSQGYVQIGSSQDSNIKKRKRKELTQTTAAIAIQDAFTLWYTLDRRLMAIKKPSESVLKQRFSEWNAHVDNDQDDMRTKPYPGYETAIKGNRMNFYFWACTVFVPLYIKIEIEKTKRRRGLLSNKSNEHDYILELYRKVEDEDFNGFKEILRLAIKNGKMDDVTDAIRNSLPGYHKIIDFVLPSNDEQD